MVKCPRGTPSQIKANLLNWTKPETLSFENDFFPNDEEAAEDSELSEELELDSNKAEKRCCSSAQNDLVYYFVNFNLDILLKSWDGKPCYKPKLGRRSTSSQSEDFGETELFPCEYLSNHSITADYLKDLYAKRSSTLTREREKPFESNENQSYSNKSEEFEQNPEEDFGRPQEMIMDLWKSVPDEEVHLVFSNGVWYRGRVSRRLMEGEGTYFWEDGTSFKGDFVDGCATGKGRLEFPSQSVYEGGVYKAFRHGEGIHCLFKSPTMYTGQWWLGKKHGEGLMAYGEPSKGPNYYRGHWENGVKEGFGCRQYPSGAKYIGYWSRGKRHGKGVMLWKNNDIYRGQWKDGSMHGYGEYTWNGFVNKTLSYPATNTHRGHWSNGKRCGAGSFETIDDGVIKTVWEEDGKVGPGTVTCANGSVVAAECLFHNDKQAAFNSDYETIGLLLRDLERKNQKSGNKKNLSAYLSSVMKANSVSIPIHSSICSINLTPHVLRYKQKKEMSERENLLTPHFPMKPGTSGQPYLDRPCKSDKFDGLSDGNLNDSSDCTVQEEKHLRNAISSKISELKVCYNKYACMACGKAPPFKCILLRLFFWQMLIDCKIPDSSLSLIGIDDILAKEDYLLIENAHDPFERIRFGQFIQTIVFLSWHLFGQYVFHRNPLAEEERLMNFLRTYQNAQSKYVLKTAFDYFLENVIFDQFQGNGENSQVETGEEKTFLDSDLAPMEAMYAIYREIGEPHSARVFLSTVCPNKCRPEESQTRLAEYLEKLPLYLIGGKNALAVAGELAYIPSPAPFNFPEVTNFLEADLDPEIKSNLIFFYDLNPKNVIQCLIRACPGIACEGFLVNMDYELTFLEFYNAVILCTEFSLKLNAMKAIRQDIVKEHKRKLEEYQRLMAEQEKFKENRAVSSKKSRPGMDPPKKGKN